MVIGYRLYSKAASSKQISETAKNLLVQLVKTYWSSAPQHVSVGNSDSGAPFLVVDDQYVNCSISHKAGCIAVAYSTTGKIGIDVENLHTNKDYQRIRNHYQDGFLSGCDLTKTDFFHHWTLAEAVAKATGVPLLSVLDQPLQKQKQLAKYFRLESFLLCAYYTAPAEQSVEISLHQLDVDNQWQ